MFVQEHGEGKMGMYVLSSQQLSGHSSTIQTWEPDVKQVFLHQAVVDMLKAAYFAFPLIILSTMGVRKPYYAAFSFVSLSKVFCRIYEYKTGAQVKLNFNGNTFISTYTSHIPSLEKLKNEKPARYCHIMLTLYKLVVCIVL